MPPELLDAWADALHAAESVLRDRAARLRAPVLSLEPNKVIEAIRLEHPRLGLRQVQVLTELALAGADGTNTGALSRSIGYDQPNVYLTLNELGRRGFVEKDESASPHRYRLAQRFR